MTALAKVSNGSSLPSLSHWMDDWLNREFGTLFPTQGGMNMPKVNIRETSDRYLLDVVAPGLSKSDFKLELDNSLLTISSDVTGDLENEEDNFTRLEYMHQAFKRTFTLPDSVNTDKISAEYTDGILHITLPKLEEAKKKPARAIKIK